MRATLVGLTLLLTATAIGGAPVPDPNRLPKQRLETLKKRLPNIVNAWAKERWYASSSVEVRLVRLLGPAQAKVVVVSLTVDGQGRRDPHNDECFTIFLNYYDGVWSATRFESSWPAAIHFNNKAVRFLMLAIDEAAEK